MTTKLLGWVCLALAGSASIATGTGIRSFSDEAAFSRAVGPITVESFNQFPVGFLPQSSLQLGNVTVVQTSGNVQIIGPGLFGFTTNFLSAGVQDGGNNVVINLPAETHGGGLKLVAVLGVTLTATSSSGKSLTVSFGSSQVSFVGFVADSPLTQIRISSPFNPTSTPIVNLGDISYAGALPDVPTLSLTAMLLLTLGLALAALPLMRRSA